jgi:hypothetical protein
MANRMPDTAPDRPVSRVKGASPPRASLHRAKAETSVSAAVSSRVPSSLADSDDWPSQKYHMKVAQPAITEVRSSQSRRRSRPLQRTGKASIAKMSRRLPTPTSSARRSTLGSQPSG